MNSLANSGIPNRGLSRWIALGLCLAIAAESSYQAYRVRPSPNEQEIARAEDEVYEAVVRDMFPHFDQDNRTLLVFDDRLVVDSFPPGDFKTCREGSTLPLKVADESFPTDTSGGAGHVAMPREDVVQDYLMKRCISGRLSRSFHTDVPRKFLGDYLDANEKILPSPAYPPFAQLFPGAPGIIGFSRVGFNVQHDEAIVYSSFYCGALCAGGTRYYLQKIDGHWQVVSKRLTWVS